MQYRKYLLDLTVSFLVCIFLLGSQYSTFLQCSQTIMRAMRLLTTSILLARSNTALGFFDVRIPHRPFHHSGLAVNQVGPAIYHHTYIHRSFGEAGGPQFRRTSLGRGSGSSVRHRLCPLASTCGAGAGMERLVQHGDRGTRGAPPVQQG